MMKAFNQGLGVIHTYGKNITIGILAALTLFVGCNLWLHSVGWPGI